MSKAIGEKLAIETTGVQRLALLRGEAELNDYRAAATEGRGPTPARNRWTRAFPVRESKRGTPCVMEMCGGV
jgi:hypothetical protein